MRKRRLSRFGSRGRLPVELFENRSLDGIDRAMDMCGYKRIGTSALPTHWSRLQDPSPKWIGFCEYFVESLNDSDDPTLRRIFIPKRLGRELRVDDLFDENYTPRGSLTDQQKRAIDIASTEDRQRRIDEETISIETEPTPLDVADLYVRLCQLDHVNPVELFETMTTWRRTE